MISMIWGLIHCIGFYQMAMLSIPKLYFTCSSNMTSINHPLTKKPTQPPGLLGGLHLHRHDHRTLTLQQRRCLPGSRRRRRLRGHGAVGNAGRGADGQGHRGPARDASNRKELAGGVWKIGRNFWKKMPKNMKEQWIYSRITVVLKKKRRSSKNQLLKLVVCSSTQKNIHIEAHIHLCAKKTKQKTPLLVRKIPTLQSQRLPQSPDLELAECGSPPVTSGGTWLDIML